MVKNGWINTEKWVQHIVPSVAQSSFHKKIVKKYDPKKNFLDIAATARSGGGQKAIFLKKMHFSGRKWHFFEKFILFKNE